MALPQPRWREGEDFFREVPVTKVIILLWLVSFFVGIIAPGLMALLIFMPFVPPQTLTGFITYPLVVGGADQIINLIFSGLMLWWFGSSLERSWGSRTYLLFLLACNVATALLWEFGIFLMTTQFTPLGTPWLMISSVVVAWASLNPNETIMLWFILPIKAKWIGIGTVVFLFFSYVAQTPGNLGILRIIYGVFSLGGVALAYAYARHQRLWGWLPRRPRERHEPSHRVLRHPASSPFRFFLRPLQEWQRRRRIAYLQRTLRLPDD